MDKQVDILIIGAGISGIGLAAHLTQHCPQRSFEIIERRQSFGGTWDLFQYPGIRSDSDMSTFGYNFKPWKKPMYWRMAHQSKVIWLKLFKKNH